MKKENFFSENKILTYIIAAVLVIAAAVILVFTWWPEPINVSLNQDTPYAIVNVSFSQLVKDEQTLLDAKDDFGMTEDDAKALYIDKNFWTMYSVLLDVDNQKDSDIVFDGFNYENKAGSNYFVRTASGGETGIPANSNGTLEINVLINCNELDDDAIDKLLMNLDIEAKYYPVDSLMSDYPENPDYRILDIELGGE